MSDEQETGIDQPAADEPIAADEAAPAEALTEREKLQRDLDAAIASDSPATAAAVKAAIDRC